MCGRHDGCGIFAGAQIRTLGFSVCSEPDTVIDRSLVKIDLINIGAARSDPPDGGLILVRELDERLGFGELAVECLTDTRAKNAQSPIIDLLRQSVYSRWPDTKT